MLSLVYWVFRLVGCYVIRLDRIRIKALITIRIRHGMSAAASCAFRSHPMLGVPGGPSSAPSAGAQQSTPWRCSPCTASRATTARGGGRCRRGTQSGPEQLPKMLPQKEAVLAKSSVFNRPILRTYFLQHFGATWSQPYHSEMHYQAILGSFWAHFRLILESFWNQ